MAVASDDEAPVFVARRSMIDPQRSGSQGRIPFRLRIGVTGHRKLADEEAITAQVRRVLQRLRELVPSTPRTPVLFTVVSALAEGADRLVAREVLQIDGANLEAPLPLPRDEYIEDFETAESKREFEEYLANASAVLELESTGTREESYERVGRYVVDHCDVLIAIWDGQESRGQGGTAEIVAYARSPRGDEDPEPPGILDALAGRRVSARLRAALAALRRRSHEAAPEPRVPLVIVSSVPPHDVTEELGAGVDLAGFRELDMYNRARIDDRQSGRSVAAHEGWLREAGERASAHIERPEALAEWSDGIGQLAAWIAPLYARADHLAMKHQSLFFKLSNALYLLAAVAVAALASQVLFAPATTELVWIEVLAMVGVFAAAVIDDRLHIHRHWLSYRFLAERFRSAFFLAAAGLRVRKGGQMGGAEIGHPSEWLRRSYAEAWNSCPSFQPGEHSLSALRALLNEAWIEDQIGFHKSSSGKYRVRDLRLAITVFVFFGATVAAAALHAIRVGEDASIASVSWSDLLVVLALALPAFGAAFAGIRAEREYERNAERYRQMRRQLQELHRRAENVESIEELQALAEQVELAMAQENRDWYWLMSFQDVRVRVA